MQPEVSRVKKTVYGRRGGLYDRCGAVFHALFVPRLPQSPPPLSLFLSDLLFVKSCVSAVLVYATYKYVDLDSIEVSVPEFLPTDGRAMAISRATSPPPRLIDVNVWLAMRRKDISTSNTCGSETSSETP